MPISIAGSGTITGISVGGIPDGVVDTDVLAANAVTTAKLGSSEASGLAKAWVNFNGTGTVAIRASYNVSSITDSGVGTYTVNFTTAFSNANYSCVAQGDSSTASASHMIVLVYNYTTSNVLIDFTTPPGARADGTTLSVAVFR